MITIYHIEARRSERVAWLMEELGLPYELVFTPMDIMTSAMAIKAVHPIGAAPTIRDGDLWLCESGAILEYLIHRYGDGRFSVKPDDPAYAAYLQWLHFAEGSAMNRIMGEFMIRPLVDETTVQKSPIAQLAIGATRRMLDFFELSLAGQDYFAGSAFTAADIMMQLPVRIATGFCKSEEFPNAFAWRERVESRPAFRRMLERALPNGPPPRLTGWTREEREAALA